MATKGLRLFWYSLYRFNNKPKLLSFHSIRRLLGREKENYGDLLSKYLIEKITGCKTTWYDPKSKPTKLHLFAIGSILNLSNNQSIVWGSGIISEKDIVKAHDFRAVRGPLTRKRILECGGDCPNVYGDPAILLPNYYNPTVSKNFEVGIVPHIYDLTQARKLFRNHPKIKVIDLFTHDIEATTSEILSCEKIISSSLHGLIIPHSYQIPAVWCRITDNLIGDNIKFHDYFASVGLPRYQGEYLRTSNLNQLNLMFESKITIPENYILNKLRQNLLKSFPFSFD